MPRKAKAKRQPIDALPLISPAAINSILVQQIGEARAMFYRLATVRSADLVRYEGKDWSDGAAQIAAEMQGFDQRIMALAAQ